MAFFTLVLFLLSDIWKGLLSSSLGLRYLCGTVLGVYLERGLRVGQNNTYTGPSQALVKEYKTCLWKLEAEEWTW